MYQYKNALFIPIDAVERVGNGTENFMDRIRGLGGEGVYTCDVDGGHLQWFESVLVEDQKDTTVKHIFVQAHLLGSYSLGAFPAHYSSDRKHNPNFQTKRV